MKLLLSTSLFFLFTAGYAQDSVSYWWGKADSAYRKRDYEAGQLFEQRYRNAGDYRYSKLFGLLNNAVHKECQLMDKMYREKQYTALLEWGRVFMPILRSIDTSRYLPEYQVSILERIIQQYYRLGQLDSAAVYRKYMYELLTVIPLPEGVDDHFRFIDGVIENKYIKADEWIWGDNLLRYNTLPSRQKYIVFDTAGKGKGQFELYLVHLPSYKDDIPFDYVLTRLNLEGLGYRDPQEGVLLAYTYNLPLDYSALDKDIRSIIRGVYKETVVYVKDTVRLKSVIRASLNNMSKALVEKDMSIFVQYLHPVTRGKHPEYEQAVAYYKELYTGKARFSFTAAEAGQPGKIVQYNGELQTVIPWTVIITAGSKKYKEIRTLSAHSLDGGKTWYFYEPFSISRGAERKRSGLAMDDGEPFISPELTIDKTIQTELQ